MTVGCEPPDAGAVLADADVLVGDEGVLLELLLPQPATNDIAAIVAAAAATKLTRPAFNNERPPLW